MSVLIATLGGSEDAIKLGVRKMANVDKVVLIAGKPLNEVFEASEIKKDKLLVDPVKKSLELKNLLEDLGIEVEIHKVNPFDFKECLIKTIELIQKETDDMEKAVNVTGGTKTLSLAANSAAWMCGCRAFIIQEKGSGDIKEDLPIPDAGYLNSIGKQMKRILTHLLKIENSLGKSVEECNDEQLRPFITKNIASSLGVKPQSIIPNLRVLESDRLIQSRRGAVRRGEPFRGKAGVKIWWLTDEGRIYATLFSR
jgi:CRISPR-associated protein Csa3